ncbi:MULTISPECIES: DUF1648 domain-containing protein [Nocardiaceae]|jgi:hypothetical protein|uniref:DUF1648 domain-containing protein n=1 Tax=Nocardiaceae TaxID=85025 RepID=UPI001E58254C|nr:MULTISPECIES: DUF1648 domain-containing protein [Rhodococcus]MCC8927561.1 DUF1648 domain-containing protein [Rhodococcus sp. I2R]MCZ4275980.1 DUF1648 domain-containing protein [Rhodococcus yunnanensis]
MKTKTFDPAGVIFGVVVPVLAAALGVIVARLWSARLPDQIATHWSGTQPDGFTSPTTSAWTLAIVTVIVGGGCSAVAALAHALLLMRRTMLMIGLTVVGLITVLQLAILARQLDATDVGSVEVPGWALGVGTAVGFSVGLLGASLLRDYRERVPADAPPPEALPRADEELPIIESLGAGRVALVVLFAILGAGAALTCWLSQSWWPIAIFLPLAVLPVSLMRYELVVDRSGLHISSLGMAAFDYSLDEITGASVREVDPFGDFGGWGLRVKGRGNYAVATAKGPAVFVTFANGERLTVTTPNADRIAGALNTLASQR